MYEDYSFSNFVRNQDLAELEVGAAKGRVDSRVLWDYSQFKRDIL